MITTLINVFLYFAKEDADHLDEIARMSWEPSDELDDLLFFISYIKDGDHVVEKDEFILHCLNDSDYSPLKILYLLFNATGFLPVRLPELDEKFKKLSPTETRFILSCKNKWIFKTR